jgi:hypothetical protein
MVPDRDTPHTRDLQLSTPSSARLLIAKALVRDTFHHLGHASVIEIEEASRKPQKYLTGLTGLFQKLSPVSHSSVV